MYVWKISTTKGKFIFIDGREIAEGKKKIEMGLN